MKVLTIWTLASLAHLSTASEFACYQCGLLQDKDGKVLVGNTACATGQANQDNQTVRDDVSPSSNQVIHLKPPHHTPEGSQDLTTEEGCALMVFGGTSFERINDTVTIPKDLKATQRGGISVEGFSFPDGCSTKSFGEWSRDNNTDAWANLVYSLGWSLGFQPEASVMACGCPKSKCLKVGSKYIYSGEGVRGKQNYNSASGSMHAAEQSSWKVHVGTCLLFWGVLLLIRTAHLEKVVA